MSTQPTTTYQSIQSHNPCSWIKLLSYGDYPHPQGLQRVNYPSCQKLVKHFHRLLSKLQRTFIGIPIYIGHPDDPHFRNQPGHTDTKAYGWVKDLAARTDGLWFLPKWSSAGQELIQQSFYKFLSPRWEMAWLENHTYTPISLLSIGLTNHPNIPGLALSNSTSPTLFKTHCLSNTLPETPLCFSNQTFIKTVHQHMQSTGQDYTQSWSYIKKSRPDLYQTL